MPADSMLDQATRRVSLRRIEFEVDKMITESVMKQSDEDIISVASDIRLGMQTRGIALSKLLCEWRNHCDAFGISIDDWEDHVIATTGLSKQTVNKYVAVWETVFANPHVPERFKDDLAAKPIQGLLLLSAASREGQLDEEDWQNLVEAPDPYTMRKIVRDVRGEKTTSTTAVMLMWRRDGTIQARRGDDFDTVGYLKKPVSDIEKIAVERILRSANILEE